MSFGKKSQRVVQSAWNTLAETVTYVGAGIERIFAPNDDEYPNTGVQPFEGEINDKKHRHRATIDVKG